MELGERAGYQGRANKPTDACYSFWSTAAIHVRSSRSMVHFHYSDASLVSHSSFSRPSTPLSRSTKSSTPRSTERGSSRASTRSTAASRASPAHYPVRLPSRLSSPNRVRELTRRARRRVPHVPLARGALARRRGRQRLAAARPARARRGVERLARGQGADARAVTSGGRRRGLSERSSRAAGLQRLLALPEFLLAGPAGVRHTAEQHCCYSSEEARVSRASRPTRSTASSSCCTNTQSTNCP